jgi:dihydroorotate dehydrogenase
VALELPFKIIFMDSYSFIRPLLFQFEAEKAHHLTLESLSLLHRSHLLNSFISKTNSLPTNLCGMQLDNPVGLAAGLDKDGKYIDALAALGFGFLEIGTVTPLPQLGNPLPRMFRLAKDVRQLSTAWGLIMMAYKHV